MKQIFTRFTFLFLLLSMGYNLQAQHILEISEPESVAGFYVGGGAAFFEGCITEPIIGEIVQATDGTATPNEGCEAITNDISGKIALLDRGSCTFEQKALNAQAAGAIALIICNNLPDSDDGGGAFGMADVEELTDPVTIPILGIGLGDCANFRVALPLNGTITNFFFIPDNDLATVWGDKSGALGNGKKMLQQIKEHFQQVHYLLVAQVLVMELWFLILIFMIIMERILVKVKVLVQLLKRAHWYLLQSI